MVTLLDLGDIRETVKLRGKELEVNGITAEHLVILFQKYPELRRLVTGKMNEESVRSLINQFPVAVAEIISIGLGADPDTGRDDQKLRAWDMNVAAARKLGVGEQWEVLQAIGRITFPQGPKSFLDGVAAAVGIEPDQVSWVPDMKSPRPSSVASKPDETKEPVGAAPQDS